jgi:hypothetical protein
MTCTLQSRDGLGLCSQTGSREQNGYLISGGATTENLVPILLFTLLALYRPK